MDQSETGAEITGECRCSFCGSAKSSVEKLLKSADTGIYICNRCIQVCYRILIPDEGREPGRHLDMQALLSAIEETAYLARRIAELGRRVAARDPDLSGTCEKLAGSLVVEVRRLCRGS